MTRNAEAGRSGMGERVMARDYDYLVPAEKLPPGKLDEMAKAAVERWGNRGKFRGSSMGGGGDDFSLTFGDSGSHMFVDVIRIPKEDGVHVRLLLRGVE